jgi:hypothetical protein
MEGSAGGPGGEHALQINVTYDSSVNSAPAGFKTAVQAAVQYFDTTFSNNISVNINFGWGELDGSTIDAGAIGESSASYYENFYTYQQIRSALATADAGSAVIFQAVQSLPTIDPTGGANFVIPIAEEKALGLFTGSPTVADGYVGLDSSANFTFDPSNRAVSGAYDAIGVLEHEISEVLGRVVFTSQQITVSHQNFIVDDPLDLFRYTGLGVHTFQTGPAYFSLNNGLTNLKSFNGTSGGDYGDWASSNQVDSFDAYGQKGVLQPISPVDLQLMELLGFDLAPSLTTVTGTSASNYTATFQGVYLQYTVGAGGTSVTGGPEGASDTLVNVQRIKFVDGYMDYSPTDPAGQVFRLYEATLGRAPDPEGLANWVSSLNSGTSLQTVANGFVSSQEFQADYGALDNTGFVTLLYNNVLHRAPDTSGLNNWVSALNSGQDTRAQVVLGFSESQEYIADETAAVGQGLWVGSVPAAETARLYDAVFGRLPDLSGLTNWVSTLNSGTSLQTVAADFVSSQEFQSKYGALDNTGFVTLLYNNVLHRAPDASGLSNWVTALNSGQDTRAQVVLGFSESQEHIADTAPHIDNGIWLA